MLARKCWLRKSPSSVCISSCCCTVVVEKNRKQHEKLVPLLTAEGKQFWRLFEAPACLLVFTRTHPRAHALYNRPGTLPRAYWHVPMNSFGKGYWSDHIYSLRVLSLGQSTNDWPHNVCWSRKKRSKEWDRLVYCVLPCGQLTNIARTNGPGIRY